MVDKVYFGLFSSMFCMTNLQIGWLKSLENHKKFLDLYTSKYGTTESFKIKCKRLQYKASWNFCIIPMCPAVLSLCVVIFLSSILCSHK